MSKVKLLASILGPSLLVATTPVAATSCSSNEKNETIVFHTGAWDYAPRIGIKSNLDITKINFDPVIDFEKTPVNLDTIQDTGKTMNDFGVYFKTTAKSVLVTITPKKSGKVSYNFKFTCYKDASMKENGKTYYVSGEIEVNGSSESAVYFEPVSASSLIISIPSSRSGRPPALEPPRV